MNYKGYIPVPVWNGYQWEPRNFGGATVGPDILPWPVGFDPSTLAPPPVQLRERVRFRFGTKDMEGEITEIKLSGGGIASYEDEAREIQRRYAHDQIHLTIYANGHGRWVSINKLIR
jgi:hypothetical protein